MWFIRTRRRDLEVGLFILIDSKLQKFKNLSIQNDPNTHTVIEIAKKILIPIDEDVANRHGIKDGDKVSLVEDGTPGRITLIFTDIRNRSRPQLPQEADDQDYDK